MKTLKQFIIDATGKPTQGSLFNESSLGRVHQHVQNKNVGIITAQREDMKKVNLSYDGKTDTRKMIWDHDKIKAANRKLEDDIRRHGMGFIHVKGRYPEGKGTPDEKMVDCEHSYMIHAHPEHKEALKSFLLKHGNKYNQDSVIWKPHDRKNATYLQTSNVGDHKKGDEADAGTFHPRKVGDFHSRLMHNNKIFTFSESASDQQPVTEYVFLRLPVPLSMGLAMGPDALVQF